MLRIASVLLIAVVFVACAPAETPIEVEKNTLSPISQTINGVTVEVYPLTIAPHDAAELMAIDSGYANLFDGAFAVARLNISVKNSSGSSVDLYPATFGSVIINGEQIDLAPFQWFADGDALDNTLLDGTNKSTEIWFPLTESQFNSAKPATFIITDGIIPVYTFDLQ